MITTTTTPTQRPLIAGVLRSPVTRDLSRGGARTLPPIAPAPLPRQHDSFSFAERDAVRHAIAEGRDTDERAIDHVVDRLLRELTW